MPAKRAAELIERLGPGWPAGPHPPADEILAAWKEHIAPIEVIESDENEVVFRTSLPNTRLRGGAKIYCLLAGGPAAAAAAAADELVRKYSAPGRLLFFFCTAPAVYNAIRDQVRCDRCLAWPPAELAAAWGSERMLERCRHFIRTNLPIRMLMLYDITISASGPMFYGRQAELGKLLEEDSQSFAVTGPGRIGKTSLVKRFQDLLLLKRDPAWAATFYVDFYECSDRDSDVLARKIAMAMEPSRRADRTHAGDLAGFIIHQQIRLGRKPTLILDEVDGVCATTLFQEQIAAPARHDHCRFILVGKSGLLKFTKDNSRPLASRLRVLRLREIDAEAARRLLFEPITDLGLDFEDFDQTFELVRRFTGCSPHMIQFYGQRLVELAAEQSTRRVLVKHVEQLKWDFNTATFFLSPIDDIKDRPLARFLALALLKSHKDLPAMITPGTIQDVGRRFEVPIPHSQAVEIGDILVIQNILSWADSSWSGEAGYRIANEALPMYAGKMGYLTRGFEEAKAAAGAALRRTG